MKTYTALLLSCFLWACDSEDATSEPAPTTPSSTADTWSASDTGTSPSAAPISYLEPPPAGEGFQISMDAEAPPGTEIWVCDVKPMPNDVAVAVNRVELQQTEGTHHLTLSTLGLTPNAEVPPGRYDCNDLYGDKSLMEDQIMFYGHQGAAEDTMLLPEGVAATIPPGLMMIHEMHYVNVTDKPVAVFSRLNAWTMPIADVTSGIWGGSIRDEHINIPAQSTHTEWSRCVMNEDVEVHFVASHTHEKAIEFTVARFDGETTGEIFYRNDDWHVPKIVQYEEPMVLKKGEGFEWACTWHNTTDETVQYGSNATDEMCNLSIVHTPFSMSALCEVVETSDGVLWSLDD